uniref:Uncharacterized protein n=1 Tax=Kalanchoe fedtschenkoi TaxID=63787 RepID=A0A7N0UGS1_KALFE
MSSLSRPSIIRAWRCILSSRRFLWGISSATHRSLKGDSNFHFYNFGHGSGGGSTRGYGTGNDRFRSNDESSNAPAGNAGTNNNSSHNYAPGFKNFPSTGKIGRNHRPQSQNFGGGGRHKRVKGGRGGFEDGFRMPDFDPGGDQLKKIFESQMETGDPNGGLDLEEDGPIEGNFRDDDDTEAEEFYKSA